MRQRAGRRSWLRRSWAPCDTGSWAEFPTRSEGPGAMIRARRVTCLGWRSFPRSGRPPRVRGRRSEAARRSTRCRHEPRSPDRDGRKVGAMVGPNDGLANTRIDGSGMRFGIVCATFNFDIVDALRRGAVRGFTSHGVDENDIVTHMNEDHADAVALYATVLLGLADGDWKMTGIDPEGCDLRHGGHVARVDFDKPAKDAESARASLVRLVKTARAAAEA
ncbi:MAG: DUF2470 domain-containing protein [Alphaproteobacteria bacterium]|nr:DUF2470 domain-containing protein [Alphaproteobacteria bacterium]